MPGYWIKLWVELIDDPKMGSLPHWVWRRFVEFLLAAKEYDHDGLLQPVPQLAWRLRMPEKECEEALRALSAIGVVAETPDGWMVVNFAKRQARVPDVERQRQHRKQETKKLFSHEPVTKCDTEEEVEIEEEEEKEGGCAPPAASASPPARFSSRETAEAIASFGNNGARRAESLYREITKQPCIPPSDAAPALEALESILERFGGDFEKAAASGKPVFAQWCSTSGKNGRNYSPVNTAWITKWLEKLAERPQVDTVASLAERVARDLMGGKL